MLQRAISIAKREGFNKLASFLEKMEELGNELPEAVAQMRLLIKRAKRDEIPYLLTLYSLLSRFMIARKAGWLVVLEPYVDVTTIPYLPKDSKTFNEINAVFIEDKPFVYGLEGPVKALMESLDAKGIKYMIFRVVGW